MQLQDICMVCLCVCNIYSVIHKFLKDPSEVKTQRGSL